MVPNIKETDVLLRRLVVIVSALYPRDHGFESRRGHVPIEFNERIDKLARDAITAGVKIPEINVPLEAFKVAKKEIGLKIIR
ncbi:hypothetical protein J6590_088309 [Homalodisca vitripennis]|nr:hypothetical protein J6590_088309 [Homalodisca vitripennis]